MRIELEVDVDRIAEEVNDAVGEEVETAASVEVWVRDNGSLLPQLLADAVVEHLMGAYA